jgi:UDP:flavonoid glycosyltransferase YjiC (YdhE family)
VHDTSLGIRLPTYEFEDEDLAGAIDSLLADEPLRRRMEEASARLQAHPGTERAADLIEALAAKAKPIRSS